MFNRIVDRLMWMIIGTNLWFTWFTYDKLGIVVPQAVGCAIVGLLAGITIDLHKSKREPS